MAKKILNDNEMIEMLYNWDDNFSDTSVFSDSSDNEVDDRAVADAIINDDSGDDEEANVGINGNFLWEGVENYAGKRQEFCGECGPRNGTQNVTEILDCFELFFDRNITDLIVTETNRYAEQYMNARAIFSAFGLRFVNGHPSHLMKFILF